MRLFSLWILIRVGCQSSVTPSHGCVPLHQVQYGAIQELHYLPKALVQLHNQYCSVQPELHAQQQQLQQQARAPTGLSTTSGGRVTSCLNQND